jgi:hypothetical protein
MNFVCIKTESKTRTYFYEENGYLRIFMTEIVILEDARTPFAKISGSFRDITATDLGAIAPKGQLKNPVLIQMKLIMLFLETYNNQVKTHIC